MLKSFSAIASIVAILVSFALPALATVRTLIYSPTCDIRIEEAMHAVDLAPVLEATRHSIERSPSLSNYYRKLYPIDRVVVTKADYVFSSKTGSTATVVVKTELSGLWGDDESMSEHPVECETELKKANEKWTVEETKCELLGFADIY